ncbi:MAG: molybdenum ABC transporter ATP-binding protein [Alphaproteobacteria bacterium]|nr:molybdenum ABC transporter ATP-binding protein [Alphaproteobacteria bacterium]
MLEASLSKELGAFRLEAELSTGSGRVTALFGPSGAGKSTLASCLAGLIDPDRGRISLDGTELFNSETRTHVAPEHRRIGYVFQDARLFPHISVRGNLRYGFKRTPPADRKVGFEQVVELLDLGHLLDRRPRNLSGGEKQRVAFGRAVLTSPRLLIMDEPLASLDAARKAEILPFIERLRDELAIPIIYVSHAIEEILRLADDVAVLSAGKVMSAGPTIETLNTVTVVHGAEGDLASVIEATIDAEDPGDGLTALTFDGARLFVPALKGETGQVVRLRIHARDVALALARPTEISVLNILPGRVIEVASDSGAHTDVRLDVGAEIWARVTGRSARELGLKEGQEVYALIKSVAIDRGTPPEA